MSKIDLNPVATIVGINANFQKIEDELNNKVFYRNNPVGQPNTIQSDVDVNGKNLFNINQGYFDQIFIDGQDVEAELDQVIEDATNAANRAADSATDAQTSASIATKAALEAQTTLPPIQVTDYTALRAYAGTATVLQVTGYLVSAPPSGIAGTFVRDDSDTTSVDNGGTIIVITSGPNTGKRLKRSYSGPMLWDWFGAKGDGVTNDTAALNAAAAAALSGELRGGGKTYLVDSSGWLISGKTGLVVNGAGSTIKFSAASTLTVGGFNTAVGVKLLNCSWVTFRNFEIDANLKAHSALGMQGCSNCLIEGNDLHGSTGGSGIIQSVTGSHNIYRNNAIHDSTVGAVRGMWLGNNNTGFDELYAVVENNHIYNCNATGLVLAGSGARAVKNRSHNNQGAGIIWSGSAAAGTSAVGVVISQNICTDNLFHGIQQDGESTYGIAITDNVCARNNNSGIFIVVASKVVVGNNVCYDNGIQGICLDTTDNFTIANNQCFDTRAGGSRTQQNGINLTAQGTSDLTRNISNGTVVGNSCYNNTTSGITVNSSNSRTISSLSILGNTLNGNGTGAFLSEPTPLAVAGLVFTGNTCQNNTTTDIRATLIDFDASNNFYATNNSYAELALTSNSATPNVHGRKFWLASNSSPTSITSFVGGKYGQEITIYATNGNTSLVHNGSTIIIAGGGTVNIPSGGYVKLLQREAANRWFLTYKSF